MNDSGVGLSISYWRSVEDIKNWKNNMEHSQAQRRGAAEWYRYYKVEIVELLEEYDGGCEKGRAGHFQN